MEEFSCNGQFPKLTAVLDNAHHFSHSVLTDEGLRFRLLWRFPATKTKIWNQV